MLQIVEVACPSVIENEREKMYTYQDLRYEMRRTCNCIEVKMIPSVFGTLGTISKDFQNWINKVKPSI